jgi:formylglycine-generating enzyme required for sulfatase activity
MAIGRTMPLDSFAPNPWGPYQVHGNVWEWAEDCWHDSYDAAPADGSAWTYDGHENRVMRGGAWNFDPNLGRSASRGGTPTKIRILALGFRVAPPLVGRWHAPAQIPRSGGEG